MKNFLIVDDHAVTRLGIASMIKETFSASIREADNMHQALHWLQTEKIDLIILDINIPGGNALHMIRQIKEEQSEAKILVFSGYDERIHALQFIKNGADGYLSKLCTPEQFHGAINTVQNSQKYISAEVGDMIIEELLAPKEKVKVLSRREHEIAQLLAQGRSVSDISSILNLKRNTISTLKHGILNKLQIANVVELVKWFERKKEHLTEV